MPALPEKRQNAPTPATARPRLEWVDAGRGISILLVVLYHSTNWLIGSGVHVSYWVRIDEALATLRMPLFFAISGLFAGKWLTKSWAALWNTKLRLFLWVFAVWEVIGAAVYLGGQAVQGRHFGLKHELVGLMLTPIKPQRELWFMWALALFFVAAKLIRRVDWRLQLLAAAGVSIYALGADFSSKVNLGWQGSMKYFFFFLCGIYLRDRIFLLGSHRHKWLMVLSGVAWVSLSVTVAVFDLQTVPGLYFVNCLLGVFAGVVASRIVSGVEPLRRIGSNTLPIYLAHTPIIMVISAIIGVTGTAAALNHVAAITPPILAVIAVTLSVLLYRFCKRSWLRDLYEPPERLLLAPDTEPAAPAA